mgnify:CR=1 FL=1
MVRVHADASRKQQALETLKLFNKYDIPKSGSTYSTMVRLMASTRSLDDAMMWKEQMLDAGFVPGPSTFGALIRGAAREQDAESLVDLLEEREQRGVSLPQVNYYFVSLFGLIFIATALCSPFNIIRLQSAGA